jgi:capsid protein
MWRMLQALFIAEVMNDFYPEWLEMSLASGAINLPLDKFEKFNAAKWQPRGWDWVDPLKEETAAEKAIKNATKTPQEIVAGRSGADYFDNIKAIRRAKDAADAADIKTPALHWWEEKKAKANQGGSNAQPAQ